SVPALVKLLDKVEKVNDAYWRAQKTRELDDLIASCAGLWFETYATQPVYALGDEIPVKTQVILRSDVKAYVKLITYPFPAPANPVAASPAKVFTDQTPLANTIKDYDFKIPASSITQPYWL